MARPNGVRFCGLLLVVLLASLAAAIGADRALPAGAAGLPTAPFVGRHGLRHLQQTGGDDEACGEHGTLVDGKCECEAGHVEEGGLCVEEHEHDEEGTEGAEVNGAEDHDEEHEGEEDHGEDHAGDEHEDEENKEEDKEDHEGEEHEGEGVHGEEEHGHEEDEHSKDEHGEDEHGHEEDEHSEDEHGHEEDEHSEEEHGQDKHGHEEDEHSEDEHGEDEHGHEEDEHSEDEHGEDEHGHEEDEHSEDEHGDEAQTAGSDAHAHGEDEQGHEEDEHSEDEHGDEAQVAGSDAHAGHAHAGADGNCDGSDLEDYDLGLHIGAVFILLGVSLLGTVLPVLLSYFRHKAIIYVIRFGAFFGFGTILSTAFIHMLLHAHFALSSPCLSAGWHEYEAWAFMFAVLAILVMQLLDYVVEGACMQYRRRRGLGGASRCGSRCTSHSEAAKAGNVAMDNANADASDAAKPGSATDTPTDVEQGSNNRTYVNELAEKELEVSSHTFIAPDVELADWSQALGFYMAELGILFHSVLIGFTLGTTSGSTFTTLLIALSFHQFFEGLAIGSSAVGTGLSRGMCFLVGLVYSFTTPAGIAIGIIVRELLNTTSRGWLLTEGILESLAAGVLIYVVLVELINPMLTQSSWMRRQPPLLQAFGIACFWAGAGVMAVIGTWA